MCSAAYTTHIYPIPYARPSAAGARGGSDAPLTVSSTPTANTATATETPADALVEGERGGPAAHSSLAGATLTAAARRGQRPRLPSQCLRTPVCACVRVCVRACVRACVCRCLRARVGANPIIASALRWIFAKEEASLSAYVCVSLRVRRRGLFVGMWDVVC